MDTIEDQIYAQYGKPEAYKEIEGKIYIQDFYGMNEFNNKYHLFDTNAELNKFFQTYNNLILFRKDKSKLLDFARSFTTFSYEEILKFQSMMTDYEKYNKLIKAYFDKTKLPKELKNKPIIFVQAGKMYDLS
jgi:hypothetical protein